MSNYVALLRGINVGGHRLVSMADLRELLGHFGMSDAKSLLQSGNLVFRAETQAGAKLERILEAAAEKRLGLKTDFIVRSAGEWDGIVAGNPFRKEAESDPGRLVVMFFKESPVAGGVEALEAANRGPEVVRAHGTHAYIVYPNGQGRSRLTNALIEKKLGTRGTARNWNTVRKLGALLLGVLLFVLPVGLSDLAADSGQTAARLPASEAEKWREDLRFLAEEMPKHHRNLFHTMTREQFQGSIRSLDARIPSLLRHQIIVEMARIVAMVGDGHTNIAPTRDPKIGFRTYPVRLYLFKDGLRVRAAAREYADLVGARVLGIGSTSVEKAYDSVREIIGRDNEMDVKFFAPFLLAMPEVLQALGLIDDTENAPFLVESRGVKRVANLKPGGPAEMLAPDTDTSWRLRPDWVDAREGAARPVPLWLRDPENRFWFDYLPDARAFYVQFNQVGNKPDETVEAFAGRLFAFVEAHPVERLVLDLRLNRGGNGELNRPLLLGIIRSTKVDKAGRLFTIVGRSTWSAAQMLVNELERYTHTIFVGEPTGGKANSYGDSRRITLPNSGITVRVSTLWWQGDERDRRPWTAPRVAANLTFEEYRANIDPVLEAALRYVPTKPLADLVKEALLAGDVQLAAERERSWRADPANAYFDTEPELNSLGYEFLAAKRPELAIDVFRRNVAASPRSANAWDSLGEAYLTKGDKAAAIRSYEKALELDPNQPSAVEALRTLRGR